MEFEMLKLIWNSALTVVAAIGALLWKSVSDKIDTYGKKTEEVQSELVKVKVDYVQKNELHRIEERIDKRFEEMKQFFSNIVRN